MKDINLIMLNPIRMRIIQELSTKKSMTSTDLCEKIRDVPRTTLYRHIKVLLDNQILTVVSEKRVRGSLERTLALNVGEIKKHNTIKNATQNALTFLMERYARFHNYFNGENPDPGKDKYFFNNTILMMDDAEFDQFLAELQGLLLKHNFEATEGRRVRDISIINSPIVED